MEFIWGQSGVKVRIWLSDLSLFQVSALAITFSFITAAADIHAQGATANIRSIVTQVMGSEQHLSL